MIQKNIIRETRSIAALLGVAISSVSMAASFNVPTPEYPHIYQALMAAASGDEIRVANDYKEEEAFYELDGKDVTIRSYSPDFSAPAYGARWDTETETSDVNVAMITISNGTLTLEGFASLWADDCNVFMMGNNSGLVLNDSMVTGTKTSDTAGIKVASAAVNVNVTCNNVTFQDNGRCIWFPPASGGSGNTMSLTLNNCQILNSTSYTIAYDPNRQGNHTVTMTDCYMDTKRNRGMRVFAWRGSAGVQTNFTVNIDRCTFVCLPPEGSFMGGRYPIAIDGYDTNNSSVGSSFVTNIRNCLFDLRNGDNDLETAAINTQDASSTRKAEINMEHCTVVFGGTNQCGVRIREDLTIVNVRNCIVDGGTAGHTALRRLQGTINSHKNLLNAPTIGNINLSGNEILSTQAGFVDRDGNDLHLAEDSPCLNVGEDLGLLVDLEGTTRPQGAGPDLGCYEREVASVSNWSLY